MIEDKLIIGLVVERVRLTGPWGGYHWRPAAIFPTPPDVAPWTPLGPTGDVARYYAGTVVVSLYSTDTANYRDNLSSGAPKLWVVMRPEGAEPPVEITLVTADPAEGEGSTEAGNNTVETIAMPADIAGIVSQFIAAHHVDRPTYKRKRDRSLPGQGERPRGGLAGDDDTSKS